MRSTYCPGTLPIMNFFPPTVAFTLPLVSQVDKVVEVTDIHQRTQTRKMKREAQWNEYLITSDQGSEKCPEMAPLMTGIMFLFTIRVMSTRAKKLCFVRMNLVERPNIQKSVYSGTYGFKRVEMLALQVKELSAPEGTV